MGQVNKPQLKSWLTGKDGLPSKLLNQFAEKKIKSWRNAYWSDYIKKFHRKNRTWHHEQEYRLFLDNTLCEYGDPEKRVLAYNPTALKGIIFGINTSVDDKFKIIQAIQQAGDKFKAVEFFQAEYLEDSHEISIRCRN